MSPKNEIVQVRDLSKKYKSGVQALSNVNLALHEGEIFALLGPNGAGKTTLISILNGLVTFSEGSVHIAGHCAKTEYKQARKLVGLVPQELTLDAFETVWESVSYSRGLFGLPKNERLLDEILENLSLSNKKHAKLITLSGGMKRRVLIARALAHEPKILFLDEPTAGVDVELRRTTWEQIGLLRKKGVTIVLTTHYLEEAEEMADRIGVVTGGRLIITEEKTELFKKLGAKEVIFYLSSALKDLPQSLTNLGITVVHEGMALRYHYNPSETRASHMHDILQEIAKHRLVVSDIDSKNRSLEEIFVDLVKNKNK